VLLSTFVHCGMPHVSCSCRAASVSPDLQAYMCLDRFLLFECSEDLDCTGSIYLRHLLSFSTTVGLCLCAEKGLRVAATDTARARLEALREEEIPTVQDRRLVTTIEVARLSKHELGSRVVPLLGRYSEVAATVCNFT
jgi:hypothetical protein